MARGGFPGMGGMGGNMAQLARQANPRRFWLTHYSPSLNHPEEYEKDAQKIFPEAVLPKDGRSITLSFDEE